MAGAPGAPPLLRSCSPPNWTWRVHRYWLRNFVRSFCVQLCELMMRTSRDVGGNKAGRSMCAATCVPTGTLFTLPLHCSTTLLHVQYTASLRCAPANPRLHCWPASTRLPRIPSLFCHCETVLQAQLSRVSAEAAAAQCAHSALSERLTSAEGDSFQVCAAAQQQSPYECISVFSLYTVYT